ncbi:MAG TPA: energy transducer TonB [Longimicrobiales bacterium]
MQRPSQEPCYDWDNRSTHRLERMRARSLSDRYASPLPIPVDQLVTLKTMQDVIDVTLLKDGKRAPAELVLPQLENRRHTLEYIDSQGAVQNVVIKKTSGNPDLDANALTIARMMRFAPARNGATPVDVWIEVPIRFTAK